MRTLVIACFALLAACSKDDAASPGGADAAAEASRGDICDTYTKIGDSCAAASPKRCFPTCDTGGCFCSASPAGPHWTCVNDTSCLPDGSPLDELDAAADGGAPPADDAEADAPDEASDASDAASDGPADALGD